MDEVMEVYLPLSRLLNLYVAATQQLFRVTDTFLGSPAAKVPYVIAVAGSGGGGEEHHRAHPAGAAGALAGPPQGGPGDHRRLPLSQRGAGGARDHAPQGLPRELRRAAADPLPGRGEVGREEVRAPVYSHLVYDIVPGELVVRRPDILIMEGLNVLQAGQPGERPAARVRLRLLRLLHLHRRAPRRTWRTWYLQRFRRLRETAFRDPTSFFHQYAVGMSDQEAMEFGRKVWETINAVNLRENIEPTRDRARLILDKGKDHRVERVWLRKI
jgi:type I pantothenate kinase